MITENQYYTILGKLSLGNKTLTEGEVSALMDAIAKMESLLDSADMEDFFGTEGWKHAIGMSV